MPPPEWGSSRRGVRYFVGARVPYCSYARCIPAGGVRISTACTHAHWSVQTSCRMLISTRPSKPVFWHQRPSKVRGVGPRRLTSEARRNIRTAGAVIKILATTNCSRFATSHRRTDTVANAPVLEAPRLVLPPRPLARAASCPTVSHSTGLGRPRPSSCMANDTGSATTACSAISVDNVLAPSGFRRSPDFGPLDGLSRCPRMSPQKSSASARKRVISSQSLSQALSSLP